MVVIGGWAVCGDWAGVVVSGDWAVCGGWAGVVVT